MGWKLNTLHRLLLIVAALYHSCVSQYIWCQGADIVTPERTLLMEGTLKRVSYALHSFLADYYDTRLHDPGVITDQ